MNIYQSDCTQKPLIFELIKSHQNEAAKLHLETHPEEIHLKGWMDDTPLHIASLSNNIELVRYLVERGAEVNAKRSSVYRTALCWSENIEISRFLLDHGATVKDDELYYATRVNKPDIVDLLLSSGAILNLKEPQYLIANSIECLQVYLDHGIALDQTDDYGKTVLHHQVWMELPEVFDFAMQNGCPWLKDGGDSNPYQYAKQRNLKEMVDHIETHYPQLTGYSSDQIDPRTYSFRRIFFFRQIPGQADVFIAMSKGTHLSRYSVINGELVLERVSRIDTAIIRNFTFDQNGNILLPTADIKILVLSPITFDIIRTISWEHPDLLSHITYLPGKKVFIAGSDNWEILLLNERFELISRTALSDGIFFPKISSDESLVSYFSYDQTTYFCLYSLTDDLENNFITTFFKDWENTSSGFAFNGNEFAVSFPATLEYYKLVNGSQEKWWEIAISAYPSQHHLSYIACIDPKTLVLGKGKLLLFIDIEQQQIIREEILDLVSEIREIYVDSAKKQLFVSTDSELKFVPLH